MQSLAKFADPSIGRPLANAGIARTLAAYRDALESLGMQDEKAFGCLRYSGDFAGRQITIAMGARSRHKYLTPSVSRRVYTGMMLTISVETTVSTRLLISSKNSKQAWLVRVLQKVRGHTEITDAPEACSGYQVWCSEPTWASEFLSGQSISTDLEQVLQDDFEITGSTISWGPEVCCVALPQVPRHVSPSLMRSWIEPMVSMAAAAEQQPPQHRSPRTWLERQQNNGRLPLVIAMILIGLPTAALGSVIFVALLIALLCSGP